MTAREEQVPELTAASEHRRAADREMTMSERLAALHELCRQIEAVASSAEKK
jgi:hypothetical protein